MRLNDKIFGKTKIKFKEGVSSSFELITTQQDQTSNLIRYYTAIRNVLESRADLDKALGVK
jgi:outer membrane protein TolC